MKKGLLRVTVTGALVVLLTGAAGCANQPKASVETNAKPLTAGENKQAVEVYTRQEVITTGAEAQRLLTEGNNRYTSGKVLGDDLSSTKRDNLATKGQKPLAIIVSCSDSRVPPEVVFDQGLGDLFVVRDAGNVADSVVTGSVEYGAEHLGAPLIVVLGHSHCGAVTAAVQGGEVPGSIASIVEKIKPAVDKAKATGSVKGEEVIEKAAELNVEATMAQLESSTIIKELVEEGKLTIVGAKYDLATGEVAWIGGK